MLVVAALYGLDIAVRSVVIEYVQRIVLLAGINVILAVGLNLINGTTGQFSIGHAGFMAVGAYTGGLHSAIQLATACHQRAAARARFAAQRDLRISALIAAAAVLAGLSGLLVGSPEPAPAR